MAKRSDKGVVVSFRVDRHLADVLHRVPDKSAFIRDLILRSFYETCPVCRGRGVLPRELAAWAHDRLRDGPLVECACCLYGYPAAALPPGETRPPPADDYRCPHCRAPGHDH